jgi:HK97 family phage prohead protease/HK97 family phage major capsid protein
MDKTKVLYINSAFIKDLPASTDKIDSIFIEGYASTVDIDRSGDVVPASVWEKGMQNYLKNPIILSQHDHDDPIGRMIEHKLDAKGLWIKARISAAAEVFSLIKDEVLTAFSIGFRILDAEYNSAAEVFVVKELELIEISVVSVPCNQNTLFNLSKAFSDAEEYNSFKAQFIPKAESAKGLESLSDNASAITKEWKMDPKELQTMLDAAAKSAAEQATKALLDSQAKAAAEAEAKAVAEAELNARVEKAVAASIKVGESGAEKLLKDIEARFADESTKSSKMLADLQGALKEKADEIAALQKSKMQFSGDKASSDYAEREKAVLLSKIQNKGIADTRFGSSLIEKTGAHLPSATWELEVSMNMEAEVRRRLVFAPLLRNIAMQTNVMTIPVNPEAGDATWMANSSFGTTASTGAAQTHALKEITLNAYKVATLEYVAYEEEEDALMVLLPIIRDGMIRRVARGVDKAYLMGAGSGADPVKGLALYDATSAVTATQAGVATIANMRALRKDLGAWGLDPAEVTYVVSTEVYYDLLDDTNFQTMNQVGTQATLLTGQVGSIGNSPVLVSSMFPSKPATGTSSTTTNYGAIAIAAGNFIAGNQRGLRFDTQDMAETQRRVLVASLRTGITQVTTNLGQGVSVFRWIT